MQTGSIPGRGRLVRLGVLSDTHGLLRPEVLPALVGVDHILHAGDVGDPKDPRPSLRSPLRRSPPSAATSTAPAPAPPCPQPRPIELGGHLFYLVHALPDLDLNPKAAGISRRHLRPQPQTLDHLERRRPLPQPRQRRPPALLSPGHPRPAPLRKRNAVTPGADRTANYLSDQAPARVVAVGIAGLSP